MSNVFLKISADGRMPTRYLDSLVTEKYFLQSGSSISGLKINVLYNDSLFNYKVFNNYILKLKKEGIKFYSSKSNRWIYLPRTKR